MNRKAGDQKMLPLRWLYARVVLYPTLAWNLLLGRVLRVRPWRSEIDETLVLGARPLRRDVPQLAAERIRAVINTCEEFSGPLDLYRQYHIEQLHIPTIDFTPPTLADVCRAVEFIETHAAQGHRVYVHCKAGRGRSATVAMCWLMKSKGLSAAEAQEWLIRRRPHVNRHLASRAVVAEFTAKLSNERTKKSC
ncbi:MAG TPA: dual specificity protein phosphatase family protein [Pirellulaceae bacterium]|nr:dual specificity protein phosphatase family protein [Pirellulaceae bacterium]